MSGDGILSRAPLRGGALAAVAAAAALAVMAGGAGDAWAQDYPFKRINPTTDFQNAISTAADGSGVQLATGTYNNLGNIAIHNAIILEPVPGAAVTISGDTSLAVLHDNVTIRGLTFEGIDEVGADPDYFTYSGDSDHRLKGAIVLGYDAAGWPVDSDSDASRALQGVTIEDNTIRNTDVHAILFRPYDASNSVTYTDVVIRNNTITNAGQDRSGTGEDIGAIVANYQNARAGSALPRGLDNVHVTDNRVDNALGADIAVMRMDGGRIAGNTVTGHGSSGIFLGPGSSGVVIEGNEIRDGDVSTGTLPAPVGNGIAVEYSNTDVEVRGNTATGMQYGIYVCAGNTCSTGSAAVSGSITVTGNTVHGNVADFRNSVEGTFDVERNYHGGGAPTAAGGVDPAPWHTAAGLGEESLTTHHVAAGDLDLDLPDGAANGNFVEIPVIVPAGGDLLWMAFRLDVEATSSPFNVQDNLFVVLEAPDGTSYAMDQRRLSDNHRVSGRDGQVDLQSGTSIDLAADTPSGTTGLIYRSTYNQGTGDFKPPILRVVEAGEHTRGTWKIKVRDGGAAGETARLTGYTLSAAAARSTDAPGGAIDIGTIQQQPAREHEPAQVLIPLPGVADPAGQGYTFGLTSGHEGTDAAVSPGGLITWTPGELPTGSTGTRTLGFDVTRGSDTESGTVEFLVTKTDSPPRWDVERRGTFLGVDYVAIAGEEFRQPLPPVIHPDINANGTPQALTYVVNDKDGFRVDPATREVVWMPAANHPEATPYYDNNREPFWVEAVDGATPPQRHRLNVFVHLFPELPPIQFGPPQNLRVGEGEEARRDVSESVTGGRLLYDADDTGVRVYDGSLVDAPIGTIPGGEASVAYEITSLPPNFDGSEGAAIDPATGVFTWTPGEEHGHPVQASYTFGITATGREASMTQPLEVQVEERNIDPVFDADPSTPALDSYPNTFTVTVSQPFSYPFVATDRDEGHSTYTDRIYSLSQSALAVGFAVDGDGTVTFRPGAARQFDAIVYVDNGGIENRSAHSFRVTAVADDGTLAFHPVGLQYADEGEAVEFALPIVNADANAVYNVTRGPDTASAEGGTFSWTPGEEDGGRLHFIEVVVTNPGGETASRQFGVQVIEANTIPRVEGSGFLETRYNFWPGGDNTYTYQITGTDEDIPEQRLTFRIESATPEGAPAAIGPDNGTVTWEPASAGDTVSLVITARDDSTYPDPRGGRSNALNKDLIAVALDGAFAVESTRTDVPDAREYVPLNFTVYTVGGNPDTSTFTCNASRSQYAGVTAVPHGRDACLVEWTPRGGDAGKSNQRLRIDVYNGTQGDPGVSRQTFSSTVVVAEGTPPAGAPNQPPVLTGVRDLAATVGELFDDLDVGGTDPDGPDAELVFGISWDSGPAGVALPPAGADFGTATGALAWTPEAGQVGTYAVTVSVTDAASETATGTLMITVALPQAPAPSPSQAVTIDPIGNLTAAVGGEVTVTPVINNPDGHALTITMAGLDAIEGESFDGQTGELVWTPGAGDAGMAYGFVLRVGYGNMTAEAPFLILVGGAPAATAQDVIDMIANATANETVQIPGGSYDIGAVTIDDEGVTLAPEPGATVEFTGGSSLVVTAGGVTIRDLAFSGITTEAVRAVETAGLTVSGNSFSGAGSGVVVAADDTTPIDYDALDGTQDECDVTSEECADQTASGARLTQDEVSSTVRITDNTFEMTGYSVVNLAGGTLNAEGNYHGGSGRVFGGVSVEPWYEDRTRIIPAAFGAERAERTGGACDVTIESGNPASFGDDVRWGGTASSSVVLRAGGEAVTGIAVVSTPWIGSGGTYPDSIASTWASVDGGQTWKRTSGSDAAFAAGIAPDGTRQIDLELRLGGGSGTGDLRQDIDYLVSCS